jgi:hypothetical protein
MLNFRLSPRELLPGTMTSNGFLQSLVTYDWGWKLRRRSQSLRAPSHRRLRARDHLHFKHSHWWEKAEPVRVRFTLRLRDQRSTWMQGGCKVYMDSYMTSNGSCFMVTWTIFKHRLLEVGLIQNQETMTLQTLTTVDLFHFIMCEDPYE